jgi:hypothetical protein
MWNVIKFNNFAINHLIILGTKLLEKQMLRKDCNKGCKNCLNNISGTKIQKSGSIYLEHKSTGISELNK